MWTYNKVNQTFIDYFKSKNHIIVSPSSVIPKNDTSLLFTNSGMVQFKNIFLGIEKPNFNRACNSQLCIRAGGKHNDLDDVGKDSYHHTCFKMNGNWSFNYDPNVNNGAYFKKEAIDYAWDLLINIYKLNSDNMYVTYFGGNELLNLQPDLETKELWLKYMPENKVLPFGMKENFWEMGASGPCGPCTEIHYDKLGNRDVGHLVNRDDPTVIEIWNLVFMQYERKEDGSVVGLGRKHVDCGAGLERITAVLNNCTNYQINLYKDMINIIQNIINSSPYEDKYGKDDPNYINTAYRVIADHTRTLITSVHDGVLPGAFGREHIVRRLIRRAVRYGAKLNATNGFYTIVVDKVIDLLADYNEVITDKKDKILETVAKEEESFNKTMKVCLRKFYNFIAYNKCTLNNLFTLYVSYGFPTDIIKQLCEENNIPFDTNKWNELQNAHIERSKK